MQKTLAQVKTDCRENDIAFVDFKMLDLAGVWRHLTIPVSRLTEKTMTDGIGFDGSNYGFLSVDKSDMVFIPDLDTAFVDPFVEEKTLCMMSNTYVLSPTPKRFEGDPRYVAQKAEKYIKDHDIADQILFGPELEFYILDSIAYRNQINHIEVHLDAEQAHWHSNDAYENNLGFTVPHHKGYHTDIPYDVNYDLRNDIVKMMEENQVDVKYHHPEVGGPGQLEIELQFGSLFEMADKTMLSKYFIRNLTYQHGKIATFMPKPFYGEAGSGMHVHLQMFKDGAPLFYDETGYSGLSVLAHYAMGGILKHAPSLLAFTNPTTNSYKRLVPGYEAPVSICYATANRSAVIRIPGYANAPLEKRFEFRSMDATCNPYLGYSAILMAMIDGIENKIDPQKEGFGPYDMNLFTLSEEEAKKIKGLPKSLEEAAQALEKDHEYLHRGGVFTQGLIQDQLKLIRAEAKELSLIPHPKEYEKYFAR